MRSSRQETAGNKAIIDRNCALNVKRHRELLSLLRSTVYYKAVEISSAVLELAGSRKLHMYKVALLHPFL